MQLLTECRELRSAGSQPEAREPVAAKNLSAPHLESTLPDSGTLEEEIRRGTNWHDKHSDDVEPLGGVMAKQEGIEVFPDVPEDRWF